MKEKFELKVKDLFDPMLIAIIISAPIFLLEYIVTKIGNITLYKKKVHKK